MTELSGSDVKTIRERRKLQIIGVAVRQGSITICLPKPNRHHDCIHYAVDTLGLKGPIGAPADDQGFYLEDGTYLNRKQAAAQVLSNGQELREKVGGRVLFSENLW